MNLSCFALQELFVETIAKDAYVYAQQGKRKTLQRKDLGMGACSVLALAKGCWDGGFFHLSGGAEAIMHSSLSFPEDGREKLLPMTTLIISHAISKTSKSL